MSFSGVCSGDGHVEIDGTRFTVSSGDTCTIRKGKVYINGVGCSVEASDKKTVSVSFFNCIMTKPVLDSLHSASFTGCSISDMKLDTCSVVIDGSIHGKAEFDTCSVQIGGEVQKGASFESCSVVDMSTTKDSAKRSRTISTALPSSSSSSSSARVFYGVAFQSGEQVNNFF